MTKENVVRPRTVLADGHTPGTQGLSKFVAEEFDLVGVAHNGKHLVNVVLECHPDLVMLDISMPELNGLEVMRQLRGSMPELYFVFITTLVDAIYVQEAMRGGASAYLLRQSAASELVEAVQAVLRGQRYITPPLRTASADGIDADSLTPRQLEVLRLVAGGASAKQIATALNISVKTAEFHKSSIMQRLNLHSTAQLTRFAIERGVVASTACEF